MELLTIISLLTLIGGISLVVLIIGGIMVIIKGIIAFFKDDKKK